MGLFIPGLGQRLLDFVPGFRADHGLPALSEQLFVAIGRRADGDVGGGTTLEEPLRFLLQRLHHFLHGGSTQAGREERGADVALTPEQLLRPLVQFPRAQTKHRREVGLVHAAEKGKQGVVR